jgi:protein-disulfide isomerase
MEWVRKKIDATLLALEAEKRGVAVDEFLSTSPQVGTPGLINGEVNESPGGAPKSVARAEARLKLLGELARKFGARSYLPPRIPGPLTFDVTNADVTGPRDASVQLVVFSDYTCGYCIELAEVLRRIRNKFPQILIVHRDFPLSDSGPAFVAAVAGKCAAEQGAFWEYHDRLFNEKGVLPKAKLLSIAGSMGLDQPRFAACLQSERMIGAVRASAEDAVKTGVPGTPALFLNGTMVGGMVDFETLQRKIRVELDATRPFPDR